MEEADLVKRVSDLEEQVKSLKAAQAAQEDKGGRLASCARFLIANWVLISVLSAGVVAVYVKYRYSVDYFESYEKISDTKKLAAFYQRLGDRLMAKSEWAAAEQSYRSALELDPNSTEATFGIVKAQVFQPLPGQKYYAPEVVDAKLDYLYSRFPDDYQIYFLKALRYQAMGDYPQAESWLRKCIQRNSEFTGCYLALGTLKMLESDMPDAKVNFTKVVQLDPSSSTGRNDLAACQILSSDFTEAVTQFEQSARIAPYVVTSIALGEAYWYTGQFTNAMQAHRWAANYLDKVTDPQDRLSGGEWWSAYLPLRIGDLETIKGRVVVDTFDQKRALAYYELAMDEALLGDSESADRDFATAVKLEHGLQYRRLVQNRMQSVENLVKISPGAEAWLAAHRQTLN